MKLRRLTRTDFDKLADTTGLQERARNMTREVLVDGDAPSIVAARHGMSKQRLNGALTTIEKAYFANKDGIVGWVLLDLELPENLALQLDALTTELKAAGDAKAAQAAVALVTAAMEKARQSLR